MKTASFRRTKSSSHSTTTNLRTIRAIKQQRSITTVLGKLTSLRTAYQRPLLAYSLPYPDNEEEQFQDKNNSLPRFCFENDFSAKTRELCEEAHFHMEAFAKLNRENPRPKGIMVRMYGWDEAFVQLWFYNRKDESLKSALPLPSQIHQKLALHTRTFRTRNLYNKLKLFLSQLKANNRKHQEAEGSILKARLEDQMRTLDQKMKTLFIERGREGEVRKFMEEAGRTQQLMLHSKMRVKNKGDKIRVLQQQLGGVNINEFFLRQENELDQIEKHVTTQRLRRGRQ